MSDKSRLRQSDLFDPPVEQHREPDAQGGGLIALGVEATEGRLGRSTIAHHASHLRAFRKWLVEQDGNGRLNTLLHDYALLPRSRTARASRPAPRPYPTIAETASILKACRSGLEFSAVIAP